MGFVYLKDGGTIWWISFTNRAGERRRRTTGQRDREAAEEVLRDVERGEEAARKLQLKSATVGSIQDYATKWVEERIRRKLSIAKKEEQRFRDFILPRFGRLRVDELTRPMIRDWVREMVAAGEHSPRMIRHLVSQLHNMYEDAIEDKLASENPCKLKKGVLPKKRDKDPLWRESARYTRNEAELFISSDVIPVFRLVRYAIMFLTGARIGEVLWWRWRHYHRELKPLGMLQGAGSWNTRDKREKGNKTETPRRVPVHPALAAILAEWRLHGWAEFMGRQPTEDDLICPAAPRSRLRKGSDTGGHQNADSAYKRMREDAQRLGLRPRDQHSARRTFIDLGIADGASKDILKWVSHGAPEDQFDQYLRVPYETLCREVSKLQLRRLGTAELAQLRPAVGTARPTVTALSLPLVTADNNSIKRVEAGGIENPSDSLGHDSGRTSIRNPDGRPAGIGQSSQVSAGHGDNRDSGDPSGYLDAARRAGFRVVPGDGE